MIVVFLNSFTAHILLLLLLVPLLISVRNQVTRIVQPLRLDYVIYRKLLLDKTKIGHITGLVQRNEQLLGMG